MRKRNMAIFAGSRMNGRVFSFHSGAFQMKSLNFKIWLCREREMPWRQFEKSSMARTYIDLQKNKISANLLQTEKEENNKEEVKKDTKISSILSLEKVQQQAMVVFCAVAGSLLPIILVYRNGFWAVRHRRSERMGKGAKKKPVLTVTSLSRTPPSKMALFVLL